MGTLHLSYRIFKNLTVKSCAPLKRTYSYPLSHTDTHSLTHLFHRKHLRAVQTLSSIMAPMQLFVCPSLKFLFWLVPKNTSRERKSLIIPSKEKTTFCGFVSLHTIEALKGTQKSNQRLVCVCVCVCVFRVTCNALYVIGLHTHTKTNSNQLRYQQKYCNQIIETFQKGDDYLLDYL